MHSWNKVFEHPTSRFEHSGFVLYDLVSMIYVLCYVENVHRNWCERTPRPHNSAIKKYCWLWDSSYPESTTCVVLANDYKKTATVNVAKTLKAESTTCVILANNCKSWDCECCQNVKCREFPALVVLVVLTNVCFTFNNKMQEWWMARAIIMLRCQSW